MYLRAITKDDRKEYLFLFERFIDDFQDINIFVGDVHSKEGACIYAIIDQSKKYVALESVQYKTTCTMNQDLEPHKGTIVMVQATLKYICQRYKTIEYISLNDKSMVLNTNIHITAKRLLQGRKGWYEEWFQATPDMSVISTRRLMQLLQQENNKQTIQKYLHITTQRNWGTTDDIVEIAPKILGKEKRSIIGTAWKINRDDVLAYPISIQRMDGGTRHMSHSTLIDKSFKHRIELFHMWHKLLQYSET